MWEIPIDIHIEKAHHDYTNILEVAWIIFLDNIEYCW